MEGRERPTSRSTLEPPHLQKEIEGFDKYIGPNL